VPEPLLSAAMIVRDEASRLPECLQSIREVVDEIVIVDTGSTDETVSIARSFGARVLVHRWDGDFAAARNAGL
jgi:glycosyltransferase involved in cell wall biosynthesis